MKLMNAVTIGLPIGLIVTIYFWDIKTILTFLCIFGFINRHKIILKEFINLKGIKSSV